MKVSMPQNSLIESLKRGAFAALSDEAQTDTSTLSLLVKSVKIKVDVSEIVFESATALISSRYVLPVTDKIVVKEIGEIMIPAQELFDWVLKQGTCIIGLRFKQLEKPETINVKSGEEIAGLSRAAIRKTGSVEIVSQDASKTGSKWSLDSYDASQVPSIDFDPNAASPLFVAPLEQVDNALKAVGVSILAKDHDHLLNSISFQHKDKEMYALTTDLARCSVYRIVSADNINFPSTVTTETYNKEGLTDAWKNNVLIPFKFLSDICKLSSDATPMTFHRDEK
jgi:DNA polymerase III sliding clamp (beta) subunit (PCNA family)